MWSFLLNGSRSKQRSAQLNQTSRLFFWIVFGGVAGWITSLVLGGTEIGIVLNLAMGMCGAYAGGRLSSVGSIFDKTGEPHEQHASFLNDILWASGGASLVLMLVHIAW